VAAGFLLVEEAGGKITAIDGQPVILESPQFLASANAGLHDQVQAVLGTADREHRKAAKASP
jgi:fructose-1,6-bisphosphatase/inositol monophosphatase family enzyme